MAELTPRHFYCSVDPLWLFVFSGCHPDNLDFFSDGWLPEISIDLSEQPVTDGQGPAAGEIAGVVAGQMDFQPGTFQSEIVALPVVEKG